MNRSCIPVVNFIDTPQFLTIALHTNTVLSTPIYFFGLYIILTKTPIQMKEVKWYLVNLHVNIILFDYTVGLLTMPILLFPNFAGYPLGVLRHYGVSTIDQTLIAFILIGFLITGIIVLFESRFFIVCEFRGKRYWSMIRRKWIAFLYVIVIFYVLPWKYLLPDQEPAKQRLFERLPCLPSYIYSAPILVLVEDLTYHLGVILVWVLVWFNGLLALLFYIYWYIKKQMKNHRMSPQTYQIQRIFITALVIQLVIPSCTLVGPGISVLTSVINNYYNQGINNFVILSITLHGSVTTISMLVVHTPYRLAIKEMFRKFSCRSTEVPRIGMYTNHVAAMQSTTY